MTQRLVPVLVTGAVALVLLVLDPVRAGTPWWEQAGRGDLLLALALPFGAWLVLSAGLCVLGWRWTTTWAGTLTQAGLVAVAGFVAGVLINLLLLDVFPDGGRFVISLTLGVLALPVMSIALMVLVVRPALHRILERHATQSRRR